MRLTFPRLCFILLAGCAFVLTGNLARIGARFGRQEMEIREQLSRLGPVEMPATAAATAPATAPSTMPAEVVEGVLAQQQKLLVKANNLGAQKLQMYLFCGVLTVLWAIAAKNTWKRRWPGDRKE